jgi:NACHT domain-containing protein
MSGYLEDWRIQIRASIGEFAMIRLAQPDVSISRGLLPAALLWPILPAIKEFDPDAIAAVREVVGDHAGLILRAAQTLEDDQLQAACALADAASQNSDLQTALEALNTELAPMDIVIDALARAEVSQRGAGDVNNISGQIKGWLVNIGGRVNIDNLSFNLPAISWAEQQARNLQLVLLKRVREIWIKGVLEQSLHHQVQLEIGISTASGAVQQPWERILEKPSGQQEIVSSIRKLSDIFAASGCAMLILGDPGAGKTTALLELARSCLDEAESSPAFPIPTFFNLSSWSPQRSFDDWLVDELLSIYQIPRRYSREWIRKDALMLMLDGLDEVRADQRQTCVATINAFREAHGVTYLAICSRRTEYESLSTRLMLGTAIILQPLVENQIEAYLQSLGDTAKALRSVLEADPALRELTHTPLLLNIMVLAYKGETADSIPIHPAESLETRRRRLFNAYVEKMLRRSRAGQSFSPDQVRKTLSWLALQMQRHSTSVFLMEQIQPSWLSPQWPRRLYKALEYAGEVLRHEWILPLMMVGIIAAAFGWGLGNGVIAMMFGVVAVLIAWGIWLAWISGRISFWSATVRPVETLRWSWAKATESRASSMFSVFIDRLFSEQNVRRGGWTGGSGLLISIARFCYLFAQDPAIAIDLVLVSIGVLVLLSFILFFVRGLEYGQIRTRLVPNQGIWMSGLNGLLVVLVGGLLTGLLAILLTNSLLLLITGRSLWSISLAVGGLIGLGTGIILGMRAGGFAFILHFVLRNTLKKQGILPADSIALLDYASRQILLQKVGGGYMFIHRLLAEYFASSGLARTEPIMNDPKEWAGVVATSVMDLWRTDLTDNQAKAMARSTANMFMPLVDYGLVDNEVVDAMFRVAAPRQGILGHSPILDYLGQLIGRNATARSRVAAALSNPDPGIKTMAVLTLRVNPYSSLEVLSGLAIAALDSDPYIHAVAESALLQDTFLNPEKIELLFEALSHPRPEVRATIILLLGHVAQNQYTRMAKKIRNRLQACSFDPSNSTKVDFMLLGYPVTSVKNAAEKALVEVADHLTKIDAKYGPD